MRDSVTFVPGHVIMKITYFKFVFNGFMIVLYCFTYYVIG